MESKKPIKNKSRKKKPVNVKVDTKNVDVEFDRAMSACVLAQTLIQ